MIERAGKDYIKDETDWKESGWRGVGVLERLEHGLG